MDKCQQELEALIESIAEGQRKVLLQLGRRLVPNVTPEDLLQPNDFPELENHPSFRYEEGVLAGILTIQTAIRAKNPMCS